VPPRSAPAGAPCSDAPPCRSRTGAGGACKPTCAQAVEDVESHVARARLLAFGHHVPRDQNLARRSQSASIESRRPGRAQEEAHRDLAPRPAGRRHRACRGCDASQWSSESHDRRRSACILRGRDEVRRSNAAGRRGSGARATMKYVLDALVATPESPAPGSPQSAVEPVGWPAALRASNSCSLSSMRATTWIPSSALGCTSPCDGAGRKPRPVSSSTATT
jgi:hypothetical protein